MSTFLIISIAIAYVAGCVCAYFSFKRIDLIWDDWTVGMRSLAIAFSVFSWLTVISCLMVKAVIKCVNNETPAKW